jgi:ATP-dependent protease ClpP protease subunit
MLGVKVMAAAGKPALRLYGDVGIDVLADDVAAALGGMSGDITVNVFSYGGDAGAGIAIHDMLARYQGRKTVVIDGVAASAASMVAMAGDRIVMPSNALMMVHNCWGGAQGDAATMRNRADMLDTYSESYRNTYAQRTGQTPELVMQWMDNNSGAGTWFSAEAAVAVGLADEVSAPAELQASVPPLPGGRFDRAPDALALWSAVGSVSAGAEILPPVENPPMTDQAQAGALPATTPTDEVTAAAAAAPVAAVALAREPEQPDTAALVRENQIRRCAAEAGLPADRVQALVDGGLPFAQAAVEIVKVHAATLTATTAGHPAQVSVTRDSGDTLVMALGCAVLAKASPGMKMSDDDRAMASDYRGWSMMDLIRTYAESRGFNPRGRSRNDLVSFAMHSTSDIPLLLSTVANKTLQAAYEEEPHTWKAIASQQNLPDFKSATRVLIAADMLPSQLLEGGEYTQATLKEASATWKLTTYAKKIIFSRQMIINDDLSALNRIPDYMGRGFRRLESNLVWALISSNANTSVDGLALFAAGHNNTGTGAIGIAGINAAKKAMRKQTDVSGATINLTPNYLIVPTDLEGTALQFLYPNGYSPTALTGAAGPNPYAGAMQLIVEPRLDGSATQWYAAATGQTDGLVYGYLADEPGPSITNVPERDPDGVTLLSRFDFGCAVTDYRFIYRSSGT